MAEIPFEYLLAGIESGGRGVAEDPPTHYLNLAGTVTPRKARYRPNEARGVLAEYTRSVDVRRWSDFEGEGGLDVYTLPLILNCIAKGGVSAPVHPVGGVVGILDVIANVADGETVTIGADVYELDVINTDSTDNTAGGSWNNVTDPLTVDLAGAGYANVRGVIGEGDLIRIENEIMKCTAIVGTDHTFSRGRSGTANAAHADAEDIYISAAPGGPGAPPANFLVGLVATLTPTQFAAAWEDEFIVESTEAVAMRVVTPGAGLRRFEITATAQQAPLTVAETLAGAGNAWQTGVATYLWNFEPTMDADDLEAMTLYWGDPNVQAFRAAFCMPDDLTISADASGTDGVTLSLSGQGNFPSKTAPSSVPSALSGPLMLPAAMQLWIDTGTIGTTPIAGRVVSAEVKIPGGIARKWLAVGPAGGLDFGAIGRGKRHAELKLVLELPDLTQYDQWVAQTSLKARLRLNGPAIVSVGVGPTVHYYYAEVDIYGPFDGLEWGEFEGSNRTVELTILSEYDESAGYDWAMRVQNDRATL